MFSAGKYSMIITCRNPGRPFFPVEPHGSPAVTMPVSAFADAYGIRDFDLIRGNPSALGKAFAVVDRFAHRPVIHTGRCVHCGICVAHCPVPGKALSFRNGKDKPPVYDRKKCIRCYCCQEMCPQKAITAGRHRK